MAMIIIDTDVEVRLLQQLERLRVQGDAARCINLHLQSLDVHARYNAVADILGQITTEDVHAYFFAEGEVFLLGRSFAVRDVRLACIPLNTQLSGAAYDPLIDFYEAGHGWSRLVYQIDERVKAQEARQQEARRKLQLEREAQARQAVINTPLDAALVQSIGLRRGQHADTSILLVEDEPFSGRLVENVLAGHGAVTLVGDGQSAILNYVRLAPHVLFLDIDLPDITGHDVLHRILEIDPKAYIVMLSGNADREHIMRAVSHGAAGFVGKPFTRDKLYQYIDRCPHLKSTQTGGKS